MIWIMVQWLIVKNKVQKQEVLRFFCKIFGGKCHSTHTHTQQWPNLRITQKRIEFQLWKPNYFFVITYPKNWHARVLQQLKETSPDPWLWICKKWQFQRTEGTPALFWNLRWGRGSSQVESNWITTRAGKLYWCSFLKKVFFLRN